MFYQGSFRINEYGLYQKDILTLKSYAGKKFKLTLHRSLKQSGFEIDREYTEKGTVNDEKLDCNISRARAKIFAYAICNDWDYFVTLTLDPRKYDRTNLEGYIKDLTKWLRNRSQRLGKSIKYLLIPELHKDGQSWHLHGLIKGIPETELTDFENGVKQDLIDQGYKNWLPYQQKFGYCSFGQIRNHEAASKYMTKYVTKGMATNNLQVGARLYYNSKGLEQEIMIKKGSMAGTIEPDYENDYVKVKWIRELGTALEYFYE